MGRERLAKFFLLNQKDPEALKALTEAERQAFELKRRQDEYDEKHEQNQKEQELANVEAAKAVKLARIQAEVDIKIAQMTANKKMKDMEDEERTEAARKVIRAENLTTERNYYQQLIGQGRTPQQAAASVVAMRRACPGYVPNTVKSEAINRVKVFMLFHLTFLLCVCFLVLRFLEGRNGKTQGGGDCA